MDAEDLLDWDEPDDAKLNKMFEPLMSGLGDEGKERVAGIIKEYHRLIAERDEAAATAARMAEELKEKGIDHEKLGEAIKLAAELDRTYNRDEIMEKLKGEYGINLDARDFADVLLAHTGDTRRARKRDWLAFYVDKRVPNSGYLAHAAAQARADGDGGGGARTGGKRGRRGKGGKRGKRSKGGGGSGGSGGTRRNPREPAVPLRITMREAEPVWWHDLAPKADLDLFAEEVSKALAGGADVFETEASGRTVLHEAIWRNCLPAVEAITAHAEREGQPGELLHTACNRGETAASLINDRSRSCAVAKHVRELLMKHPAGRRARRLDIPGSSGSAAPASEDAAAKAECRPPGVEEDEAVRAKGGVPLEVLEKRVRGSGHQYLCTIEGGGEAWLPGKVLKERYPELLATFSSDDEDEDETPSWWDPRAPRYPRSFIKALGIAKQQPPELFARADMTFDEARGVFNEHELFDKSNWDSSAYKGAELSNVIGAYKKYFNCGELVDGRWRALDKGGISSSAVSDALCLLNRDDVDEALKALEVEVAEQRQAEPGWQLTKKHEMRSPWVAGERWLTAGAWVAERRSNGQRTQPARDKMTETQRARLDALPYGEISAFSVDDALDALEEAVFQRQQVEPGWRMPAAYTLAVAWGDQGWKAGSWVSARRGDGDRALALRDKMTEMQRARLDALPYGRLAPETSTFSTDDALAALEAEVAQQRRAEPGWRMPANHTLAAPWGDLWKAGSWVSARRGDGDRARASRAKMTETQQARLDALPYGRPAPKIFTFSTDEALDALEAEVIRQQQAEPGWRLTSRFVMTAPWGEHEWKAGSWVALRSADRSSSKAKRAKMTKRQRERFDALPYGGAAAKQAPLAPPSLAPMAPPPVAELAEAQRARQRAKQRAQQEQLGAGAAGASEIQRTFS